MKCIACGKQLTDEESKKRKMGDDCWKNYNTGLQAAGASEKQIKRLEGVNDSLTGSWTRLAKQAMAQMKIGIAKTMLERAERRAKLVEPDSVYVPLACTIETVHCADCYGTGTVYEFQCTGATGAMFTAEVPCHCVKPAAVQSNDSWCEPCFSSDCKHIEYREAA
jgi:hypothetical protein